MNNKIKKTDDIIKELEEENDYLKEDLDQLEKIADKAEAQTKEMVKLKEKLAVSDKKIRDKEAEVGDLVADLRKKDNVLDNQQRMLLKLEDDLDHMKTVASEREESDLERNHVIKVLEHESKVYKFEKNVIGTYNVDGMNP